MSALRLMLSTLLLTLLACPANAEIPTKTRQDIVRYAATGIGSPYVWGGGSWDPDDRGYGGADCSGFVSKSWSLARWTPYRVEYHGPYSTASLIQTPGAYWDEVDRADLVYGDAIVIRYDSSSGHTYLYLAGDGWGQHEVYEARGTAYGIVHRWRETGDNLHAVKGIRRHALIENVGVTEHIVETDDGAPYYTDVGMTGSSSWDSSAPGCTEGQCRYRWVTATRNETCTFIPDLPEAGWYRVYVTCNEGDPNVQGVGVTVNHAGGSNHFTWNQADAAALNTWVPIGGRSFLFNAGMDGTVVWDDFNATPTDGAHIFRGDATKFTLDNRVEVDGVGGAAGTFATVHEALAWLAAHESEEPDVIDVTCDTLVETGCLLINLIDDVTIKGDADDNGVPVTIALAPSVPAGWSRPCGVYLDVPIQHHYTLRDLTIVPQYVSAGYDTGAYGLVIDEQNPSDQACAMSVLLEGVTVAASLPGHVPTAPFEDHRAQATMFGSSDASYGSAVLQRSSGWAGDADCRQAIVATDLTITHSATRGLALESAYTDWDIAGGLVISYCGLEGIRAQQIDGSSLVVRAPAGAGVNRIQHNLGGGVVNIGNSGTGTVSLANCLIRDNQGALGGGLRAENAQTTLRNALLTGNIATSGGGVYVSGGSLGVAGCTLVDNTATSAGAILSSGASVAVANSILWANGAAPLSGSMVVTSSNVEGGQAGAGNIADDPAFVDALAADYHLQRRS
ncbi:MAG TPA: NlpC/P60 family protein, partial [Phycisphaerae bacterium]|nr:NlpC/P60 family protein [Phycisphaerae bacterium]